MILENFRVGLLLNLRPVRFRHLSKLVDMNIWHSVFRAKYGIIDRNSMAGMRKLREAENLSAKELRELNWNRRVSLVNFCAEKIPFYQRKFKEIGFVPSDLKEESDFQRLPILEKEDVRSFAHELVNPAYDINTLTGATTGGTTGEPLKTYSDPNVHISSMSWRMLNWWGVDVSDSSGYLYRAIPVGLKKLAMDVILWPTRRSYIAAADMTYQNMICFYRKLKRTKSKYLVGYVGAIDEFARFVENNDYSLPSLEAVWTTSAPLPATKRKAYERIYSCPVYTQYGSCEFYWIAAECQNQSGLHIGSDIRHVDIVDGNSAVDDGSFGDIVVTDLLNYTFPLLRYRIGDRGRLLDRQCDCGLPFPMMDYVKGRVSDAILLPDGTSIPGEYWTTIFDDFTDIIRSFQVHQKRDYSLVISYECYPAKHANTVVSKVDSRLAEKIQNRIAYEFKETEVTGHDDGKIRFVTSELKR